MGAGQQMRQQFGALAKRVEDRARNGLQDSLKEIGERVVRRTPVMTGELRAHWNLTKGAPDLTDTDQVDPGGDRTVRRLSAAAETIEPGDGVYLANAQDYAAYVERGTADTPPVGMLRTTLDEAQAIFDAKFRRR